MGYDADAGFTSTGVDPSWKQLLTQLENSGIDKATIEKEMSFIKDFVKTQQPPAGAAKEKKVKPPPPPSRKTGPPPPAHPAPSSPAAAAPPPPPPP
ncbi:hypothetical protein V5O48_019731, partial [Marasmius crinis-equi]